jgi:hypothetical protein
MTTRLNYDGVTTPPSMERGTLIFVSLSVGMALILVVANLWDSTQPIEEDNRILEVCLQSHSENMLHYHATLSIVIRGENQVIPTDSGVIPGCMRGIHTHDDTGKLHIETPEAMEARLEHFFQIWEQPLTSTQLLDATVGDGESISLSVNGELVDDPRNHILGEGQELVLTLS